MINELGRRSIANIVLYLEARRQMLWELLLFELKKGCLFDLSMQLVFVDNVTIGKPTSFAIGQIADKFVRCLMFVRFLAPSLASAVQFESATYYVVFRASCETVEYRPDQEDGSCLFRL